MNHKTLYGLILILMASCSHRPQTVDTSSYRETFYSPTYSKNFRLKVNPDVPSQKLLEVYSPDTMSVIIPSGGFKSIVCLSSTYIGYLSEADATDRIKGISRIDLVTDSIVKTRAIEVGYDGAFDYEAILSVKPDIMLIYGVNGPNPIVDKLNELGIRYLYIHDFEERHPLGRAEWMIAVGALAGKDMRSKYEKISAAYSPKSGHTKIMLNAPYSGAWFIPGTDNYMSRLIADAGGLINAPQPIGAKSEPIDMEIAIPALNDADIWLNPGQVSSISDAQRLVPKTDFCGNIWNQTPDFYESGATRPDLILDELTRIFNNDESIPFHYFTKLQ